MGRQRGLAGLDRDRESLDGAGVVITGGSRGIGRAVAEEALAAGASVVIAARGAPALQRTADELAGRHPGRISHVAADVASEADVHRLMESAKSEMGRVDGLVHAAAVLGPIGRATDVDLDAWWETLRINLFGTFLVVRAAAAAMDGQGRMVLLSGGGATSPFPRYSAYAAGKAAVVRLVETLAEELGPGIALNALAPGFVATDIHEGTLEAGEDAGPDYLARTRRQLADGGVPAELAGRAAVFLLSDRATGITGRLLAAPWDEWWDWPEHLDEIEDSDLFTLRRIVPRDRGASWQ